METPQFKITILAHRPELLIDPYIVRVRYSSGAVAIHGGCSLSEILRKLPGEIERHCEGFPTDRPI